MDGWTPLYLAGKGLWGPRGQFKVGEGGEGGTAGRDDSVSASPVRFGSQPDLVSTCRHGKTRRDTVGRDIKQKLVRVQR